jgi:hypothetical protein
LKENLVMLEQSTEWLRVLNKDSGALLLMINVSRV